jgi:hypothetical protein
VKPLDAMEMGCEYKLVAFFCCTAGGGREAPNSSNQ